MVQAPEASLERVRAQAVLLMLVELTARPQEQIGELERLRALGEPLPDENHRSSL